MSKKQKQEEYPSDFVIEIDTREQEPYFKNPPKNLTICRTKLDVGDYSIRGFENCITIERKGTLEFLGSISNDRERFKAELKRMIENKISHRFIVIEGTLEEVMSYTTIGSNPKGKSEHSVRPFTHKTVGMAPEAVFGTLVSLMIRYDVHFIFAKDRKDAEKWCLSLLLKFYKLKRGNEL